MGKETKRRQLGGEAEGGKVLSTSKKRQREEGLSNERSQDARKDEGEEKKNEERLERAIDELLVECRRKASDGWEKAGLYEPGEELEVCKRSQSSFGWAGEEEEPSHSGWKRKQSVGIEKVPAPHPSTNIPFLHTSSARSFDIGSIVHALSSDPPHGTASKPVVEPLHMQIGSDCSTPLYSLQKPHLQSFGAVRGPCLEVLSQTTRCGQSTEGVFPLPLPEGLKECLDACPTLDLVVRGLNSLYGVESRGLKKVNKVQRRIIERLKRVVECSEISRLVLPPVCLDQFFATKGIDYSGEEVRVARAFEWKMIAAAFPEGVGSLEVGDFCDGGTLSYVSEFEKFLLPPQDQRLGKTPAVMVSQTNWAERGSRDGSQVCLGLIERGALPCW